MSLSSSFSAVWSLVSFNPYKSSSMNEYRSNRLPDKAKKITLYGTEIAWHAYKDGGRHIPAERLDLYRQVGDPMMDPILEKLDHLGHPLKPNADLLFAKPGSYPPEIETLIQKLLDYHSKLPSWAEPNTLRRGQMVYIRYFFASNLSLLYRSLISGFSVPKLAKVIQATAYLAPPSSPEQVFFRLIDTFSLVAVCTMGIEGILPGGEGWKTALYVRVLHAKVRRALLKRQGNRTWDCDQYGIPINQEDMAATLLAFSVNTLDGIEFCAGTRLSRQEKEDYLCFWRYIGWVLGVHTSDDYMDEHSSPNGLKVLDPCGSGWYPEHPDPMAHARSVFESMLLHLVHPNAHSVSVAHHLLQYRIPSDHNFDKDAATTTKKKKKTDERIPVWTLRFYFRALLCRRFIGDELADALQLPIHESLLKRTLLKVMVLLNLWFVRLYTWVGFLGFSYLDNSTLKLLNRFLTMWKEKHATRMATSLTKNEQQQQQQQQAGSLCPFAMIHSP